MKFIDWKGVMSVSATRSSERAGECIRHFLDEFLFKIDHCREDNTAVHYQCGEVPYSITIECSHYEGFSTEELALLLAGLLDLEKCLGAEAYVELLDRATEKLRVKVLSASRRACRGG